MIPKTTITSGKRELRSVRTGFLTSKVTTGKDHIFRQSVTMIP
jgi:hypothetical protein